MVHHTFKIRSFVFHATAWRMHNFFVHFLETEHYKVVRTPSHPAKAYNLKNDLPKLWVKASSGNLGYLHFNASQEA